MTTSTPSTPNPLELPSPTLGSKRARPATTDIDGESLDQPPLQRAKLRYIPKKDVEAAGKVITRSFSPFVSFAELLHRLVCRDKSQPADERSTSEKNLDEALLILCGRLPSLADTLLEDDDDSTYLSIITTQLQNGRSEALSTDVSTLKQALPSFLPKGHGLEPQNKSGRGWKSDATGQMLCRFDRDWNDVDVKAKIRSGTIAVTAKHWPHFLFQGGKCEDVNKLAETALRGPVYTMALGRLFFGCPPKSLSPDAESAESTDDEKGTAVVSVPTRCLASTCSLESITPPVLAYTAILLRSAASREAKFVLTNKGYNYTQLFNSIVKWLDEEDDEVVASLMKYWNGHFFPDVIIASPSAGNDDDDDDSVEVRLIAQREARRRLAEEAEVDVA